MNDLLHFLHHVFIERLSPGGWVVLGSAGVGPRRSVVPTAFWSFSLIGGFLLFIYALQRRDPVFIIGQGAGLFIYARNISLIVNERKRALTVTE